MTNDLGHCGCMEHAGFEEGNWPLPCRTEITVSFAIDQIDEALFKRSLRRGLRYWEDVIDVRFVILPHFTKEARIWITDAALPGSTLAWSFLANNSCGSSLEQRYDTLVDWNEDYLTATIVHEVGHALGITHSDDRDDIMYPSITMNTIKPSAGDVRRAVAIGYHKRISPLPPIPDPPTPEPEPPKPPKGPTMNWIDLIIKFAPLILECIEKDGESAVFARVRSGGGLRGTLALWRQAVADGVRGRAAVRARIAENKAELAAMNDEDLREMVAGAQAIGS